MTLDDALCCFMIDTLMLLGFDDERTENKNFASVAVSTPGLDLTKNPQSIELFSKSVFNALNLISSGFISIPSVKSTFT